MDDTRYMKLAAYGRSRGISYKVLRQLLAAGKLAAGKVGRNWLVDAERCDAFFTMITTPPQERPAAPAPRRRGEPLGDYIRTQLAAAKRMAKEGRCAWEEV